MMGLYARREPMSLAVRLAIIGSGLDGRFEHRIGASRRKRIFDPAHAIEAEGNRPGITQIASMLCENGADLALGAVAVVRERFHDHANTARSKTFAPSIGAVLATRFW